MSVYAEIVTAPINLNALVQRVERSEYGGIATFLGIVRDNALGNAVLYLEYEAYQPLASTEMARIAYEAAERWKVSVAVEHRVGKLEIGEASVAVAVGAAHRGEAFDACRWVIDTLKQSVPIWKKEYFAGGAHWVEGPSVTPASTPPEANNAG